MLTDMQHKEILQMVKKYKFAKGYLANHYKSRRARMICEKSNKIADMYLRILMGDGRINDKITSEDVKYFALIVDLFEPMRRNSIFKQMQPYADFDIGSYIDKYNNGDIKTISDFVSKEIPELSAQKMDELRSKYKDICDDIERSKHLSKNTKRAEKYRSDAYYYASAIVDGGVNISPENLQSAYWYLNTLCYPYVEGDVADRAKSLLNEKIEYYKKLNHTDTVETPVAVSEQKQEPTVLTQEFKENVDQVAQFVASKDAARKKAEQEKAARREQAKKERKEYIKSQKEKFESLIQNASGKVSGLFSAVKNKIKEKRKRHKIKQEAQKAIVLEKPAEPVDTEKKRKLDKAFFGRAAAAVIIVAIFLGGSLYAGSQMSGVDKTNPKQPAKKEIKAKPVVEKQVQNVVSVDTAYMNALNNYYNSALDIIAGTKKADVLNKIENQVKEGNVVLTDSISVERVAYAYFIYREYGFKIDVLDLAVNGNQKLTDAQQAELVKVIMDAGERGTGVQKMAKQRVEARGGQMSQHSKFKNATKQQQRQHLVNLGLLKKAHVK